MHSKIKDIYICWLKKEYLLKPLKKICGPKPRYVRPDEFGIYVQGCSQPSYWDFGIIFVNSKYWLTVTA